MAGSRFVRADLHVHTMLDANEATPGSAPSVEAAVQTAKARGVAILGITDHNHIANVRQAVALSTPELLILPGIEISTPQGHLLALFPPEGIESLEDLARHDILRLRRLPGGGQRSTRSMSDLIGEIDSRGGLAIPAHIDTADGLLATATPAILSDILVNPGLAAVEITQLTSASVFTPSDSEEVRRDAGRERARALGDDAAFGRVMSSDAHSPEEVGVDEPHRTMTRLRLDDLNFLGVRSALRMHPDARCKLELNLETHYPKLTAASFVGGFLDGQRLELSPNLNCLIGGRGSGKTTALDAIRAALGGTISADDDSHPNMPDVTEVTFIDALGTKRTARRERHQSPVDADEPSSPIDFAFAQLEQNFGAAFLDEDSENPEQTLEFLRRFEDMPSHQVERAQLLAALEENGQLLRRTDSAESELVKLEAERAKIERSLATATDANLVQVAEYARILSREAPLIDELIEDLTALGAAAIAKPPDLDELAARFGVDLTAKPAVDFVTGTGGLRQLLKRLGRAAETAEGAAQVSLATAAAPTLAKVEAWRNRHEKWEAEIERRRVLLKAAGLSLQVDELDRIRVKLRALETKIREAQESKVANQVARGRRKQLLSELRALMDRRFTYRKALGKELSAALNQMSGGARVSVTWKKRRMRLKYGTRLGQIFGIRSPKSERLAGLIDPEDLAGLGWAGNTVALGALGKPGETFLSDPDAAMDQLFAWDVLFELETMDIEDLPEIRIKYPGDPSGPGRLLSELSLGQARSILLGFLLVTPGFSPLILDQPEDQLDGPFLAGTVVGYLHGVKERRQLLVATHNANLVVLGDAEMVAPLEAGGRVGRFVDVGSVDRPATSQRILLLLEGGEVAFRGRATRYGYETTPIV